MATVLLGVAGGIVGGAIGGPIGATIGRALGSLAGSYIDGQIVAALTPPVEGPRLTTSDIQTSTEGAPIPRLYGRARLAGNIIWATQFQESLVTETSGGKGGSSGPRVNNYDYAANFATALCEGPIAGIGRIWADGKEIDQDLVTIRVYRGTETQNVDPLIEAKETDAPAYRGLAYVVFELLPLSDYGNRIPQISIEVYRPTGDLEAQLQGVALLPGNEFGFDPQLVKGTGDDAVVENRHTMVAPTDFVAAIDRLEALAPNLQSALLVVPWFGDDLRCGACTIRPKVDTASKPTTPYQWSVGGLNRAGALVVSYVGGEATSGGTPSDASVIRAIQNLQARGLAVTLVPFIMMDVPAGNTLPNPYSNGAAGVGQPEYPWRGRITGSPAAGFAGTADKTASAATQVASFMGTAAPGHFSGSGTTITYSGPAEWRYRRFILHHAKLAALAGGVEAFLIGSEMIGLTQLRSSSTAYPFVAALKTLAADVSGVLGAGVKVGYAADWSEWNTHRPADASGDVLFHLDPLWSDANVDFIGVDAYLPLADWREGSSHLDFSPEGPTTIYDPAYLSGNVRGGEGFAWFYADQAARDAQTRIAIVDGSAANEPWIFRQKDFLAWWSNAHHDRPGGVRSASPTGWVAQGKPVRFIEYGCPAVDKGANQPNVFPDFRSSEGGFPYFSTRARDDAMQRAYLRALLGFYAAPANNPVSSVYAQPMLDLARSHAWCWDVRPWPSFPLDAAWGDAPNWETGHWISGRLGAAPAEETIRTILNDAGFADFTIEPVPAVVDAVTVGTLTSPRALLESLRSAMMFDTVESEGLIKVMARLGRPPVATLAMDDLVILDPDNPRRFRQTRAQETELPDALKITYGDPARDDQMAGTEARRSASQSQRTLSFAPPVVMAETLARASAEIELHGAWVARESAAFALPPSFLRLDPGDVVAFAPTQKHLRIASILDAAERSIEAFAFDPAGYAPVQTQSSAGRVVPTVPIIAAEAVVADAAMLRDDASEHAPYLGGIMAPWRAGMAVWRSPSLSGFTLDTLLPVPGTVGTTTGDFYPGPTGRWDRVNALYLRVRRGTLLSAPALDVLNGANVLLLENADGEWEILQFATATPNGERNYILTDFLRGQRGSEHAMRAPVASGARVMLVNAAVRQASLPAELVGLPLTWRAGPADRDIGSPEHSDQLLTMHGRGRRPLSPARLRGVRDPGTGDWAIGWTRRTRVGGDGWDQVEVPLGEETERYRLQVLSGPGGAVLRSADTAVPAFAYSAAMQAADFGVGQYAFWARVSQLSATYGAGVPAEALIWVR